MTFSAKAKLSARARSVYAVDLKEEYIDALEKKGEGLGYQNIEWHVADASDLNFIKDE